MRWLLAVPVLALVLVAGGPSEGNVAKKRGGVASATCAGRSFASFPRAYRERDRNLVAGPLAFVTALENRDARAEQIEDIGGFKSPALLRRGHRARVSIAAAQRSNVRLAYGRHGGRSEADFAKLPHTVRFSACPRRRDGGRRPTFWSGFFVIRDAPTCVRVRISIDGRAARERVIPVAQPSCP